jgi:hypothetical protein
MGGRSTGARLGPASQQEHLENCPGKNIGGYLYRCYGAQLWCRLPAKGASARPISRALVFSGIVYYNFLEKHIQTAGSGMAKLTDVCSTEEEGGRSSSYHRLLLPLTVQPSATMDLPPPIPDVKVYSHETKAQPVEDDAPWAAQSHVSFLNLPLRAQNAGENYDVMNAAETRAQRSGGFPGVKRPRFFSGAVLGGNTRGREGCTINHHALPRVELGPAAGWRGG